MGDIRKFFLVDWQHWTLIPSIFVSRRISFCGEPQWEIAVSAGPIEAGLTIYF